MKSKLVVNEHVTNRQTNSAIRTGHLKGRTIVTIYATVTFNKRNTSLCVPVIKCLYTASDHRQSFFEDDIQYFTLTNSSNRHRFVNAIARNCSFFYIDDSRATSAVQRLLQGARMGGAYVCDVTEHSPPQTCISR